MSARSHARRMRRNGWVRAAMGLGLSIEPCPYSNFDGYWVTVNADRGGGLAALATAYDLINRGWLPNLDPGRYYVPFVIDSKTLEEGRAWAR